MFNVDGTSDVSFIRRSDDGADFWAIEATGNYAMDCQRGREAAGELNRAMFFGSCPPLLGSVARAIVAKGNFSGLEVGFFQQIAEDLARSPHELIGEATRS